MVPSYLEIQTLETFWKLSKIYLGQPHQVLSVYSFGTVSSEEKPNAFAKEFKNYSSENILPLSHINSRPRTLSSYLANLFVKQNK